MRHTITLIILFIAFTAMAQDKLDNSFSFTNGIYTSFEDFKNDSPTYSWQDISTEYVVMEERFRAKSGIVKIEESGEEIPAPKIWGICVNGRPYIRTAIDTKKGLITYSGLSIRGNICYFEKEFVTTEDKLVSAYNPHTGKPFRTGVFPTKRRSLTGMMLKFETGEEALFNNITVREWIGNDKGLSKSLEDEGKPLSAIKLIKYLKIYNDRNPILLPKG